MTDYYNRGLDVGPSNADRRHELVFSGGAQLPGQIVLGAIWNIRSSYPFSAKAGVDLNGDDECLSRVVGWSELCEAIGLDAAEAKIRPKCSAGPRPPDERRLVKPAPGFGVQAHVDGGRGAVGGGG